MTDWIPQLRTDMGPNDDLTCYRCDKPTERPNDKFCVHCALDLGYAPIGDRDPWE